MLQQTLQINGETVVYVADNQRGLLVRFKTHLHETYLPLKQSLAFEATEVLRHLQIP